MTLRLWRSSPAAFPSVSPRYFIAAANVPIVRSVAVAAGAIALDIKDDVIAGEPGAISIALRSFNQSIRGAH
jgi:hypothetical protein